MSRVEGQLWIDRNSPYRLKYYVNGREYEVSVLQNYEIDPEDSEVTVGSVVKINEKGKVERAIFPRDIDQVVGVVSQIEGSIASISESDSLYLTTDEVSSIFYGTEITEDSKGAPVYWFIGRTLEDFTYVDSSTYAGYLTLDTPSGYQWNQTSISEDSFNVGYSNLPTVGHIIEVGDDYVIVNLHMSGFSLSQEWSWPLFYKNGEEIVGLVKGYSSASSEERGVSTITIRHGLFPNNKYNNDLVGRVRCFCDVIAMPSEEGSDTEYVVQAAVDNYIGHTEEQPADSDKRTEIIISTPETLRYSVTGRVLYNFNKEVVSNG